MKKTLLLTLCALFLGAFSMQIQAQNYDYDEIQLPNPDNMSLLFFGAIAESKIYYGETPSNNQDKPVIVFVHGFIDLANLWFTLGNDMYEEAYDDGYRTAFVALTRGEGMWTNGAILADMLEDITDHYGVDDVVIVAHSNGGKSAEVAMFAENKYDLVDRVITLGTPFRGTGVADLAETPAFNWLVDFIGLGGGTSTSTTYYMDGVARPILDNDPDNQPGKFINFGGWGYKNGTTIIFPVMTTSGTLLNAMGGRPSSGGNDGVTPYYSSTRPGGYQVWDGWAWCWWCNRESKV
ncbi:MAG: alpha/beta hydrolase, partial [Bacteroidota bacterium]